VKGDFYVKDTPVPDTTPFPGTDPSTGTAPSVISYHVPKWNGESATKVEDKIRSIEGYNGAIFIVDNKSGAILTDKQVNAGLTVCHTLPAAGTTTKLSDSTQFMVWAAKSC